MAGLISYERALTRVLDLVPSPSVESASLDCVLGRVLAASVKADLSLPPFKKSFMDGYALRSQDVQTVPSLLRVTGTIAAGSPPGPRLRAGEAIRIMTGAPVPPSADAVQMVEKTRLRGDMVEILEKVEPGQHIAAAASEVRKGQTVLKKGRILSAQEVAILASFGRTSVEVYRRPAAAVLSTGDELVEVDQFPGPGQIRNSNAHMLYAQCCQLGIETDILPIVKDDPIQVRAAIRRALRRDLVILSGGVSMGEHDYVHSVLADEGADIAFHKAAIKPGKPVMVGRLGERILFGLPGNPVSSFVTFLLFVKPVVLKWQKAPDSVPVKVVARLQKKVVHSPGRQFFKPALAVSTPRGLEVEPIDTRGSADIVGFGKANALLIVPAEVRSLPAGKRVEILLLNQDFGKR